MKIETMKMGRGKNAIICNKKDYDNDFPLHPQMKALKAKSRAKPKVESSDA